MKVCKAGKPCNHGRTPSRLKNRSCRLSSCPWGFGRCVLSRHRSATQQLALLCGMLTGKAKAGGVVKQCCNVRVALSGTVPASAAVNKNGKSHFWYYFKQIRNYELVFILTYTAELQTGILLEMIKLFSEDLGTRWRLLTGSNRTAPKEEPGGWRCARGSAAALLHDRAVTHTSSLGFCSPFQLMPVLSAEVSREGSLFNLHCTAPYVKVSRFQGVFTTCCNAKSRLCSEELCHTTWLGMG